MFSAASLEKISKATVYLLAFLIPLWFLPVTQNAVEYPKQILLIVFAFIGVMSWLGASVRKETISLRTSSAYILFAFLFLAVAASTVFSLWPSASFFGLPISVSESMLSILGFGLFAILMANTLREARQVLLVISLFVISSAIAAVFMLSQLFVEIPLPFRIPGLLGTYINSAMLSAVLIPITLVLLFQWRAVMRVLMFASLLVFMSFLIAVDLFIAWIALTVGLLILLGLGMWKMQSYLKSTVYSFALTGLVVAFVFMLFPVSVPGLPQAPQQVVPPVNEEVSIAKNVLQENPVTGSGPGTFVLDYGRYHSVSVNESILWNTRFSSGYSEILDWVITTGVLGFAGLVGLWGSLLLLGTKEMKKEGSEDGGDDFQRLLFALLSSFAAIGIVFALIPVSFVTWFMFWMLVGGILFSVGRAREYRLLPASRAAFAVSFGSLLIIVLGIGVLFLAGQRYAGEVWFVQGARAFQQGSLDKTIEKIETAATLNPYSDVYQQNLAQLYLLKISQAASDSGLSSEERERGQVQAARAAIEAAKRATELAPANVANWNVLGFVYRNLVLLNVQGAADSAVESYEKAEELEPNSPFPAGEIGRVYALEASRLRAQGLEDQAQEALAQAAMHLNRAIDLKSDYAAAHYLLAAVYEGQGRQEETTIALENAVVSSPRDIGLRFQLGMLYWQQEKIKEAKQQFESALRLNSSYSNARYMLGLAHDALGEDAQALAAFQRVAESNPENEEVQRIIANLQNGSAALEGITPSTPPIGEAPEEIAE